MWRDFTDAARKLWRTFADMFDPYRPEAHYMRGPGPKWHAKRGNAVVVHPLPLADSTEVHA